MRKKGGRKSGKRFQYVSDRGDRGLFNFNVDVVFDFKYFRFRHSKA
jgi:hypothetical protein